MNFGSGTSEVNSGGSRNSKRGGGGGAAAAPRPPLNPPLEVKMNIPSCRRKVEIEKVSCTNFILEFEFKTRLNLLRFYELGPF